MEQKEQETKFFDFTQVLMEVRFDEMMEVDISQTLGNVIHMNTGDIGLDEIARTIYKEGKADIPVEYIPVIVNILKMPTSLMAAGGKRALIEIFSQK
jgi:hypothetical protein